MKKVLWMDRYCVNTGSDWGSLVKVCFKSKPKYCTKTVDHSILSIITTTTTTTQRQTCLLSILTNSSRVTFRKVLFTYSIFYFVNPSKRIL